MLPLLAVASAIAAVWSVFIYQTTYAALIDWLPLQFRDGLNSKFAFPVHVLRPSTPLTLQWDYVKSQLGLCVAALGFSLFFLFSDKLVVGCIVLAVFLVFAALTIKTWKTYAANCDRRAAQADTEAP